MDFLLLIAALNILGPGGSIDWGNETYTMGNEDILMGNE